jgi:hypothetical protein
MTDLDITIRERGTGPPNSAEVEIPPEDAHLYGGKQKTGDEQPQEDVVFRCTEPLVSRRQRAGAEASARGMNDDLIGLAEECHRMDPARRPTMDQVVARLESCRAQWLDSRGRV